MEVHSGCCINIVHDFTFSFCARILIGWGQWTHSATNYLFSGVSRMQRLKHLPKPTPGFCVAFIILYLLWRYPLCQLDESCHWCWNFTPSAREIVLESHSFSTVNHTLFFDSLVLPKLYHMALSWIFLQSWLPHRTMNFMQVIIMYWRLLSIPPKMLVELIVTADKPGDPHWYLDEVQIREKG